MCHSEGRCSRAACNAACADHGSPAADLHLQSCLAGTSSSYWSPGAWPACCCRRVGTAAGSLLPEMHCTTMLWLLLVCTSIPHCLSILPNLSACLLRRLGPPVAHAARRRRVHDPPAAAAVRGPAAPQPAGNGAWRWPALQLCLACSGARAGLLGNELDCPWLTCAQCMQRLAVPPPPCRWAWPAAAS